MRGEDMAKKQRSRKRKGSPPHARGRPTMSAWPGRVIRITPACAGKTHVHPFPTARGRDHPRMRGEDSPLIPRASDKAGSPPHARGRLQAMMGIRGGCRITPACAGKTQAGRVHCRRCPDHPRMRGEDSEDHAKAPVGGGITPACAGKTAVSACSGHVAGDHPRMRGEDREGENP